MLPPVLEVFVLHHPGDRIGDAIARRLVDHFHGTAFTGLIGGAVEVFVRSTPWQPPASPPRPIALPGRPALPDGLEQPLLTAVIPVLGRELVKAVEHDADWQHYLGEIMTARAQERTGEHPHVEVIPLRTKANVDRSVLKDITGHLLGAGPVTDTNVASGPWLRDLVQGLTQFASRAAGRASGLGRDGNGKRLTVFLSHTRQRGHEESGVAALTDLVQEIFSGSRLGTFFDAQDLQLGDDWREDLRARAAGDAVLCLRTDLYAGRDWCQEEVLIHKRHGAAVLVLGALETGELRGSFLLDHAPRVPVRRDGAGWSRADVERGLGLLVDECLKRELWRHQQELWRRQQEVPQQRSSLQVAWWAPHAPEPLTLVGWLAGEGQQFAGTTSTAPATTTTTPTTTTAGAGGGPIAILHPDPPLADPERDVLNELAALAHLTGPLDIMTPRQLASRGG